MTWQTIDTAPKDGSKFILYFSNSNRAYIGEVFRNLNGWMLCVKTSTVAPYAASMEAEVSEGNLTVRRARDCSQTMDVPLSLVEEGAFGQVLWTPLPPNRITMEIMDDHT